MDKHWSIYIDMLHQKSRKTLMKTCTVFGDLSSDRASENYPTVQICDECLDTDEKSKKKEKNRDGFN